MIPKKCLFFTAQLMMFCIIPTSVIHSVTAGSIASDARELTNKKQVTNKNTTDENNARFGNAKQEDNPVQISSTVVPDGSGISLLFDFLSTSSGKSPGKDNRISTKSVSFKIPLTDNNKDLCIKHDIRGFVRVPDGTRATLFMQLCGKTTVMNWTSSVNPNGDIYETFKHTLPKGKECLGTLFLLTERDSENVEEALLVIDSLDITILEPKAK